MDPIIYIKDAKLTLKVGAGTVVAYQGQVKTAEVVPTAGDTVKTTTLDGLTHERQGAASYALHLVANQDYSATGLGRFLWDHARETADFVLQAYGQGTAAAPATPQFSGQVVLTEGTYGGEVDTWAQMDITLICVGRPTLVTA